MKLSLKVKVLIIPVLLMFISTVLMLIISLWIEQKLWNDTVADLSRSQAGLAEKSLHSLQTQALTIAALASEIPGVKKAYEVALAGNEKEGRRLLREGLDKIHTKVTETMGIKHFKVHYHLPPATSLLRIWRKAGQKDGGDDISSFRKTVLKVNSEKTAVSGIEVGRGGFAIRGLVPVTGDNGRHLGSVETLLDFNKIFETARFLDSDNVAVYMNSKELEIARKLKEKKLPEQAGLVRIFSSDKEATDPFITEGLLHSAVGKTTSLTHQGRLITGLPIKDFSGNVKGVLVFVRDASDQIALFKKIKWGLIIGGSLFLVVVCLFLYVSSSTLVKSLQGVMSNLSEGSNIVDMVSRTVSSSSDSLASGAAEQAASIEETSASMEETSSMVRNNAENASQANSLMTKMGEMTELANEEMERLKSAMKDISLASEETSKIIKTIDEIAFQTNLLALNAAVEAARAGDAGSGFAVVADEVRNLAMRSKDAAQDTTNLIEETLTKVKLGDEMVTNTSDTFSKVSLETKEVEGLVREISTASSEQAEGINQIGKAISEMETVTQSNSASAEESAAASTELQVQAHKLSQMVTALEAIIAGSNYESDLEEGRDESQPGTDPNQKLLS